MTGRFGRRTVLMMALFITIVAAWFAPSSSDSAVVLAQDSKTIRRTIERTERPMSLKFKAQSEEPQVLAVRVREDLPETDLALFPPRVATVNPVIEPQAPPPPPPPPPPQAPPLPFKVLGRYMEGGRVAVFLQYQDQNLVARVGDTIDLRYNVERIDGVVMSIRYLPLNQLQTLDVGGAN